MEENLATVIDWLFQLGVNEDGVNKSANEFIRHEYLESKSLRNLTQQMVLEKCPEFFNGLIINPSFHSILKKFAEVPNRSSNEERELANFCGILAGFVGIQSERKAKPRIELITAEIVMALQEMIEDTNTNTHSQTYGLREESLQILCESEATYFISVLFLHFIKQNVSNINYYVHTAEQSLDRRMKKLGLHDTLLRKHFQGENKKKNKDQQLENNDDNLGAVIREHVGQK
ncbi:MAG: hypothetical protein EZS28_011053 [Streblomastix strix]|uniref:Uncharacterized protein n=1 Tax=Streblomastix strix TaxID=222440 RepID=A0A5J4WEM7_9EUKA|nr:MAG: hypothetical protein EZS28_011053 [Streblomastix strix]